MVVYCHGMFIFYQFLPQFFANVSFSTGAWGVELFFALSGFLVGKIYIEIFEKYKSFGFSHLLYFWKMRWYRTLPNYYLILILLIFVGIINHKINPLITFIRYATFTQNMFTVNHEFFKHSWSLSIEEWSYILFPAVVFLIFKLISYRIEKKYIILFTITLFLLTANAIRWYVIINSNSAMEIQKITIYRLDAIIVGIFFAYLAYYKVEFLKLHKFIFLIFGVIFIIGLLLVHVLLILVHNPNKWGYLIEYTFLPIAFTFLLPFFSEFTIVSDNMFTRLITLISKISYSTYLIHFNVLIFLGSLFNFTSLWVAISYFFSETLIILLLSYILYIRWEKPFMDRRKNLIINFQKEI